MTATAPPTWALSHVRHLNGVRRFIESFVEEEAGRPMWALPALLAVIPDDQRQLCLADLRMADYGGGDAAQRLADAIERTVAVYDQAMAAAYGPPERLSDEEVHDCHPMAKPDPYAEFDPVNSYAPSDSRRGGELFGAAANYATAEALRAGTVAATDGWCADGQTLDKRIDELVALLNEPVCDEQPEPGEAT